MKHFLAITALAIAAACVLTAAASSRPAAADPACQWNMPGPAPHLVAHYIPWFTRGDSTGWQAWSRSIGSAHHDASKRLPNGRRDIASVVYPLIGPYDCGDPAVVRYDLATMKAAGIQGVFVDWQAQPLIEQHTAVVVDEAAKLGMKVGICYEEKSNFVWPDFRNPATRADAVQYATNDLKYILSHYASQPSYMRCNGLPVMFQFNGSGSGRLGPNTFSPDEWKQIIAGLPEKILFGRQGLDPAYDSSAQFRYIWFEPNPQNYEAFVQGAEKMVASGQQLFFMSRISPGFDDTGVWGWGGGPRVTPRNGLSFFKYTFDQAFQGNPQIIQIVTWNDFNEGTVVEPTLQYGFDYLDALATWMAERRGGKADLAAIRQPFLDYVKNATPAERAELPPGPMSNWTASRHLTVEAPQAPGSGSSRY